MPPELQRPLIFRHSVELQILCQRALAFGEHCATLPGAGAVRQLQDVVAELDRHGGHQEIGVGAQETPTDQRGMQRADSAAAAGHVD